MGAQLAGLAALAGADEVKPDQLKKQLLRHQIPVAVQVESLVQLLTYQKSLIPQHLVNPLIDNVIQHVAGELSKLKIDAEAEEKKKQEALAMMSKMDNGQIEKVAETLSEIKES